MSNLLKQRTNARISRRTPPSPSSLDNSTYSYSMSMHSRNGSGNPAATDGAIEGGAKYSPLYHSSKNSQHDDNDGIGAKTTMPELTDDAAVSSTSVEILRSYAKSQYARVTAGLASLSDSPPELWKAYLLKFLDSYSYFSFSLVFTLFLSDDFGMSDVRAGTIYGTYGAMITVFGLVTGTVIDNLGVAKCLRIGFVLSFLSRMVIFACSDRGILLVCLLVTLPFSNCLGIPVLTVGIRRYTKEENRGFAFGLFYVVMNVGALVAGPLVDMVTHYYNGKKAGDGSMVGESTDRVDGTTSSSWVMTNNRAIILTGVMANFIAIFVAFSVREIKVDSKSAKQSPLRSHTTASGSALSSEGGDDGSDECPPLTGRVNSSRNNKFSRFRPTKGSSYQILMETIRTPSFHRFLLVCLLTINVRMVFRHLDGTLPKYMVREFGEDTPKGMVYAINPALIIILVPIITAATTSVDPLIMIHRGTYVSALSVFFLAFSTSLPACILFVVTLSIGEAMWSPRLYDYTMSVAQEGREGTFMALSSAPLFLAKLPVGFLSGLLLQRYCPEHLEEGEVRQSKTMWWIIGLSTIVSPILITLLWSYISGGCAEGASGRVDTNGARMSSNNEGERLTEVDDYNDEKISIMEDNDSLSEHSYQHQPLTSNISLPRVRSDRSSLA
mmetsp:Transcript_12374/g.30246  ORF Transcript_12374/g.30246 Transcript_12374/m.30246 type:complete len:668 (+) Transcript_12374:174-2177(+)